MTTDQISALLGADPAAVIAGDRQNYRRQILRAAQTVAANADRRPIVLLAGPSGSGKTTTALLIERELDAMGIETHTLQMDNYFIPLTPEQIQAMDRGELDLETPERVDMPLLQEHFDRILACQPVELPHYDFKTSRRLYRGQSLCRKPGELVIVEGIHALNPTVTGHGDDTLRIYVSVRTRITDRQGRQLHPSMIRLARRLIRDQLCRGRDLDSTISMRRKVDRGEQLYIMPHKHRAHCSIDSFHAAELSIYRGFLLQQLEQLLDRAPELEPLLQVMRQLPQLPASLVPGDCLLREFIGGSQLPY